MANADSDGPHTFASLPPELITLVAEELDARGLARFAAASTLCRAAAHSELRAALRTAVQRSLKPLSVYHVMNALALPRSVA